MKFEMINSLEVFGAFLKYLQILVIFMTNPLVSNPSSRANAKLTGCITANFPPYDDKFNFKRSSVNVMC